MSVAPATATAARRLGAGVFATVAGMAALATVVCALAWLWAAAVTALTVLLAAATGFWSVLGRATSGPAHHRTT